MPEERRSIDGLTLDRLQVWRDSIDARLWGGGNVAYERSLEGRLSAMETALQAAEQFERAARDLRRAGGQRWSRWAQIAVVCSAFVTAAAAVVSAAYVILS